jgi:O-antigen/teichoic acid export membrane protein
MSVLPDPPRGGPVDDTAGVRMVTQTTAASLTRLPLMTASKHARTLTRALAASGTTAMVVGTLVSAAAAYAFQLVAGRALGPEQFAPITVLWTIQFLVFTTVFLPMEQLTIRRLAAAEPEAAPRRLFLIAIILAVAVSTAFGAATLDQLLDGRPMYLAVVMILIATYGAFALARGSLAGRRRFDAYGWATMTESVVRLGVAAGLIAAGAGVTGVAWSLIPGALLIYLWSPFHGTASTTDSEAGAGVTLATFVTANAASQTIVAAGPLVVGALGASAREVSIFFETFLLFRAPLTVAYSLVARVLPPFTRTAESEQRPALAGWAIRLGIVAAVLAGGGFVMGDLVGADLVAIFLGSEYRPDALLAAYAIAGVVIATTALFVQQMLIALRATGALAGAWFGGLTAAAVTIIATSGSASDRVALGFVTGEAVALALIVLAVVRVARSS